MKVAIDISPYYYGKRGVTRYIRCLTSALRALEDPTLQIEEIGYRIPNFHYTQPLRALKTIGREFLWQPFVAPYSVAHSQADLLHATCNPCLRSPLGVPKIITLHDLEMFYTPDRFRWWSRKRFFWDVAAYRRAQFLLCVSQATADDAMKFLEFPASKIVVTPLGSHFTGDSPEAPPQISLPSEYFLFVSALEPGKNLKLLNDVYKLAENRNIPLPPLLIVGERVQGVSHEGTPPAGWTYLGHQSDLELTYLYRRAIALLVPTRYEGFGLPVLEAMTLGTAVICSPISSLPEVGGDVPFYAEQTPSSYLEKMLFIIQNSNIRDEKISAGLERAKLFSWQRCAQLTSDVYRSMFAL
jgi:glycosyltransferase involved in cell wall biosynthesis